MKGDSTATMETLLLQAGWLRRFALALVRDQDLAEDIVQETLVTAWQRPAKRAGRPWLATVARNLAINRWRGTARRQRRELQAIALDAGTVASPEELVGDAQIHRTVAEAVAALDEPFRQTLVLRFFDGVSSADIARRLQVSYATVRWRIKEGLDRVRAQLDARYGHIRQNWVTALLPLLPRSPSEAPPGGNGGASSQPRPWSRNFLGLRPITMATVVASVACMALMAITIASHHRRPVSFAGHVGADPTTELPTGFPSLRGVVPLSPQPTTGPAEPGTPPPGPGEADVGSWLKELLEALQTGAYDDFVARGSAGFKAALRPDLFRTASDNLGKRLAVGYQPSLLGSLRHRQFTTWLFRLEFADQGDDALVHLVTDGWQLAGFQVEVPEPNEKEE